MRFGRIATIAGIAVSIFTALIASTCDNLMNYLQALFSIFNRGPVHRLQGGLDRLRLRPGRVHVGRGLGVRGRRDRHVLVTLRTKPKPIEELQGLVYGMANVDESVKTTHRWWESPKLLRFLRAGRCRHPDDRLLVSVR